eukprot:12422345-Karenia_brevis.AAC.1
MVFSSRIKSCFKIGLATSSQKDASDVAAGSASPPNDSMNLCGMPIGLVAATLAHQSMKYKFWDKNATSTLVGFMCKAGASGLGSAGCFVTFFDSLARAQDQVA